jgi:hypothetical protein
MFTTLWLKRRVFSVFFVICFLLYTVSPVLAAPKDQAVGCGGGLGPIADALCNITSGDSEIVGAQTNKVLSGIIGFLTVCAGLWFGIQMILGGYDWINSGGDKGKLETARNKIVYAIIGMVIVVAAYIIIGLIATLLGINILNPGEIISTLGK